MNDSEWTSWQSSWSSATGPLPAMRKRAQQEVRIHRLARAAFFGLIFATLAISWPTLVVAPERKLRWIALLVMAFLLAMSTGYLLLQRSFSTSGPNGPHEAIAFLERRLRFERYAAHLIRWAYAGVCIGFLIIFPQLIAGHENPWLEKAISYPWMALVFAVTFTAPWWVARRNRKHQEEIDRWRRWMNEQHL